MKDTTMTLIQKGMVRQYLNRAVVAIFTISVHVFAHAIDCAEEYRKHLATDLELSYEEFDQTLGKGMRPLANAGCAKETADLILAYIEKNSAKQNSLVWHVAQQRALQGDYADATKYANLSLMEKEDFSTEPLRWNDYVLATVAFMQKDKDKLRYHRDKVAEGKAEFFGNALNLKLLDKLLANFDLSYKDAAAAK
jgi:hypothetical protein